MRTVIGEKLTFKSVIRVRTLKLACIISLIGILLFFISSQTFASSDIILKAEDARYVSKLDVWITLSGEISFYGEGELLEVNLSIPYNNGWQDVIAYPSECELVTDADGNVICRLRIKNPPNIYRYTLRFHVVSESFELRTPLENHSSDTFYPPEVQRYLRPTEHIQSDAPEIRALARALTKNARNEFEKVALLAIWVNENVVYDERYATENKDALWVLNHRRGVCAEYTTLFIALARAIGIPARYAHVYAFGKNGWESHAIAEVYMWNKWVPVDVLWLEIGGLDATHIYMGSYLDNRISNNIRVEGYGIRNVEWRVNEPQFEILSLEKKFPRDRAELQVVPSVLPPSGSGVVWVKIVPFTTKVEKLTLLSCKGAKLIEVEEQSSYLVESIKSPAYHYWIIHASDYVDPHYEYVCPLTLNTFYTEPRALPVEVRVSPLKEKKSMCWSASLLRVELQEGADVNVMVNAEKCQDPVQIYVGNDRKLYSSVVLEDSYIFLLPQTQLHKVYVFDENGNYAVLEYRTSKTETPFIARVFYPKMVYAGNMLRVKAEINNPSRMKNVTVKLATSEVKLKGVEKEVVVFNLSSDNAGKRVLWLKLLVDGKVVDALPVVYDVVEKTRIDVKDAYVYGGNTFMNIVVNNPCYNLTVVVDGKRYKATPSALLSGENRVTVNVSLTGKNVKLLCYDGLGSPVSWRGTIKTNKILFLLDYLKNRILPVLKYMLEYVRMLFNTVIEVVDKYEK